MSYEDEIIAAANQGYPNLDPKLKELLRLVYKAGYQEAQRNANGFTGLDD
jgi:hypothetical protein